MGNKFIIKIQVSKNQNRNLPESPVDLPTPASLKMGKFYGIIYKNSRFDQQWLDNQLTTNGYDNVKAYTLRRLARA